MAGKNANCVDRSFQITSSNEASPATNSKIPLDASGATDRVRDGFLRSQSTRMVEAPFRDLTEPLLHEIREQTRRGDTVVTVVLPELIPAHWWENLLHNQTALGLKRTLLFEPGVVVTSVPFHIRSAGVPSP